MRLDNRSSSLQLLKLAFGSAKFSPRRVLTTLALILLFATGSLYITKRVYQRQKLKSSPTGKTQTRPKENIESIQRVKKQPAPASKSSVSPQLPELRRLRQEHRRKIINQLKSQLQTSALGELKRKTQKDRRWLGGQEAEKLARHQSILSDADEVAKLQLQDQQLYSEEDFSSSLPDEEALSPPPKQKPGFWSELRKEFYSVLKEFIRKFI